LFPGEWAARNPIRGRLMDAIRQTRKSIGKEVKTVLLIDDEPALLELLAKTLVYRGFQVLQAPTSAKGLDFAKAYHPDVIILDLTMPECDGVQVVQQLRAHPASKMIPILVHTGTTLNEPDRQRLAAQVYSISSKTDPEGLLADLERLEEVPAELVGS
jgi:DNA-binding response OmpR family regulator